MFEESTTFFYEGKYDTFSDLQQTSSTSFRWNAARLVYRRKGEKGEIHGKITLHF